MGFETESNAGFISSYGARTTNTKGGGKSDTRGMVKSVKYDFVYDSELGGADDFAVPIPAGAAIVEATFIVTTLFAGGTDYNIGLELIDGSTAVDADGLFDALILADIDTTTGGTQLLASTHDGTNSGLLIGDVLAADSFPVTLPNGTFSAGAATLVIDYIELA